MQPINVELFVIFIDIITRLQVKCALNHHYWTMQMQKDLLHLHFKIIHLRGIRECHSGNVFITIL